MTFFAGNEKLAAFRAFSHQEFRKFYIGSIAAQVGFWFSHISYQALMSDLTKDELWVSLLFVVTFLPVLFFGPLGGLLADRLDRKRLLLSAYAALILVSAIQVFLVVVNAISPGILLLTSFLIGLVMAVLSPVVQAVTANTVPQEDLASAISLQAMSSNASRVLGPALCAPIVSANLYEISWSLYSLGVALALVIAAGITLLPYELESETVPVAQSLLDGIMHARGKQEAWRALLLVGFMSVFGVSHVALTPSFTENSLGKPSSYFAWLGAATGLGALVGALAAGSFTNKSSLKRGSVFAVPYCFLLLGFSRVTNFEVAIVLQVLVGFFYIASFTTLQVVIQELVDEEFRGRVMSLFNIAWAGLVPIGTLLMGLLASSSGFDLGSANTIAFTSIACFFYVALVVAQERQTKI